VATMAPETPNPAATIPHRTSNVSDRADESRECHCAKAVLSDKRSLQYRAYGGQRNPRAHENERKGRTDMQEPSIKGVKAARPNAAMTPMMIARQISRLRVND